MNIQEMMEQKRRENLVKADVSAVNAVIDIGKNTGISQETIEADMRAAAIFAAIGKHPELASALAVTSVKSPTSLPAKAFGATIDLERAAAAIAVYKEIGAHRLRRMIRSNGQSLMSVDGFFYCEIQEDITNGESYQARGYLARCEIAKDGAAPVVGDDPKVTFRSNFAPGAKLAAREFASGDTLRKPPEVVAAPGYTGVEKKNPEPQQSAENSNQLTGMQSTAG